MRPPVFHQEQAPTQILCWSGEGSVNNILPFRQFYTQPSQPFVCFVSATTWWFLPTQRVH